MNIGQNYGEGVGRVVSIWWELYGNSGVLDNPDVLVGDMAAKLGAEMRAKDISTLPSRIRAEFCR